jgi:hypothetical protein
VKFTGQVRLPEIDHPGVPATILVEDDQVEVFLEGESLGRWSLVDVEASRLVSAAFSLSLDHEEITFIADEPVDFAYKGVDHMAEVWARYKAMAMPRRMMAVGRSRRGTLSSRIGELRTAMLQNLDAAGRAVPRLAPIETVGQVAPTPTPAPPIVSEERVTEGLFAPPEPEPAPLSSDAEQPVLPAASTRVEPVVPSEEKPAFAPPPPPPRLRPGAGLMARRVYPARGLEEPAPVFAEPEVPETVPTTPEAPEPRAPAFGSPWDEPAARVEPGPVREPPAPVFESPAPKPVPEPVLERPVPTPVSEPEPSVPEPEPEQVAPAASTEVPELVKELLGTSSDEGGEEGARDLVVDLGHYEGRGGAPRPGSEPPPAPSKEPALTGAPAETAERSGLLGAVRSAFARNKVPHEHEFVEAPGGIGIVRQICEECGYISIGVSD